MGALFAYVARQLGRVLSTAFGWATLTLFGRVPQSKQLFLSAMTACAVAWPVVIAGIAVPSIATFLFAFVTVPPWLVPWVRPIMLALAVLLPLAVGALSTRLHEPPPRGGALARTVLRGYPSAAGLFAVIVWMMVVAPATKIVALARRWDAAHVPIAIEEDGYASVVRDLAAALARTGLVVGVRRAGWAYELPGHVLAFLGGPGVRRLVPPRLSELVRDDLRIVVHPMDLAMTGRKGTLQRARAAIARELTFTAAYQTWSKEAQEIERELARAARGDADLDEVATRIAAVQLDYDEWEILYRILLQVRLRVSPVETDAVDVAAEPAPSPRERLRALLAALRGLYAPPRARHPRPR